MPQENEINIQKLSRNKAVLFMIVCSVCWSFGGLFIKLLPWNVFVISGLRSGICALTMFLLSGFRLPKINRDSIFGALIITTTMILFISANKLTTAANAIVLQYTHPVFIILICYVRYRQKIEKIDLIAVIGALCGITLFFFDKLNSGNLLGNFLAILSGFTNAMLFVYCNRTKQDSTHALILGHFLTFLVSIPFLFLSPPVWNQTTFGAILFLGVVQQGIAYLFYVKAAKSCTPIDSALLSILEPLCSPIWVLLFIHEKPGIFALVGGVIILSVILFWNLSKNKKQSHRSADILESKL